MDEDTEMDGEWVDNEEEEVGDIPAFALGWGSSVRRPTEFPDPESYDTRIPRKCIFIDDDDDYVVLKSCKECRRQRQACNRAERCSRCKGRKCEREPGWDPLPKAKYNKPGKLFHLKISERICTSSVRRAKTTSVLAKILRAKQSATGASPRVSSTTKRVKKPLELIKALQDDDEANSSSAQVARRTGIMLRNKGPPPLSSVSWSAIKPQTTKSPRVNTVKLKDVYPRIWTGDYSELTRIDPSLSNAVERISYVNVYNTTLVLDKSTWQGDIWDGGTTIYHSIVREFSCKESELEPAQPNPDEETSDPMTGSSADSGYASGENTFSDNNADAECHFSPQRPTCSPEKISLTSPAVFHSRGPITEAGRCMVDASLQFGTAGDPHRDISVVQESALDMAPTPTLWIPENFETVLTAFPPLANQTSQFRTEFAVFSSCESAADDATMIDHERRSFDIGAVLSSRREHFQRILSFEHAQEVEADLSIKYKDTGPWILDDAPKLPGLMTMDAESSQPKPGACSIDPPNSQVEPDAVLLQNSSTDRPSEPSREMDATPNDPPDDQTPSDPNVPSENYIQSANSMGVASLENLTRIPQEIPPEVNALLSAHGSTNPITLILSREYPCVPISLPEECHHAYLGLFVVKELTRLIEPVKEQPRPGLVNGRVTWRFALEWTPGGEAFLPDTVETFTPWWRPADMASEEYRRDPHGLRYNLIPLNLLVSDSGESERGWYCYNCGRLNGPLFFRHSLCPSSHCQGTRGDAPNVGYAKDLQDVREPSQCLPLDVPVVDHHESVHASHEDWADGTRSYSYTINKNTSIKLVTTLNDESLQAGATHFFREIQMNVELSRQTHSGFSAAGSYFAHFAGYAKGTPWNDVPECISHVREFIAHNCSWYGELKPFAINKLATIAWIATGTKRGSVIDATASSVAILCLGSDVTFSFRPKSGHGPVAAEVNDDGSPKKLTKGKKKDVQHSDKPFQLTMVHGDIIVLIGDIFQYSMTRTGTSMLLIGS